jgi:Questin oxidase-like
MAIASYGPLDEALDRLAPYGPALTNGNFNHAPMVAEVLCALGRPDAVLPWVERYRPRLVPRDAAGEPIDAACWRDELDRRDRFVAWSRFFAAALDEGEWPQVLDLWVGHLAPGISAAATHGAIRVGHAVRALSAGETPPRRQELADALASWAATYAELPSASGDGPRRLPPRQAIARVAVVPPEQRRPGNIAAALARLVDFPEFMPAIGLAELDGDLAARLAELTELFARVYVANVHNVSTAIVFIHGVTSLTAAGHIAPHIGEANARSLLRYGWQAGCGLYACFGGDTAYAADVAAVDHDPERLIDRAVANGDEHVIKFTEACLSRHAAAPSPAYPACAANVLSIIGVRG